MFFSRKTEGKLILMLEIQSSLVRGSLIWFRTGTSPVILSSDSRPIPYKQNSNSAYLVKTALKGLSEIIDAASRRSKVPSADKGHELLPTRIEEVHYVLSSPWVVSQARTLAMSFEKETDITADRMADILNKERGNLIPADGKPLEVVEEKIFDVRLNGYSIPNWLDKPTRELEVAYAVSASGGDYIKRLREASAGIVRPDRIHFHSALLLQYIGLRKVMPARETYTLLHIHGEITDAVVVDHGLCLFFCSYPMGVNNIVRKIAAATKTDIETAGSLLSLYLGERLDEAHMRSSEPVMREMSEGWSREFEKLFKGNPLAEALPRETIIVARAHEDFFMKSFQNIHPHAKLESMSLEQISSKVVYETAAERMRIIGICALALCDII